MAGLHFKSRTWQTKSNIPKKYITLVVICLLIVVTHQTTTLVYANTPPLYNTEHPKNTKHGINLTPAQNVAERLLVKPLGHAHLFHRSTDVSTENKAAADPKWPGVLPFPCNSPPCHHSKDEKAVSRLAAKSPMSTNSPCSFPPCYKQEKENALPDSEDPASITPRDMFSFSEKTYTGEPTTGKIDGDCWDPKNGRFCKVVEVTTISKNVASSTKWCEQLLPSGQRTYYPTPITSRDSNAALIATSKYSTSPRKWCERHLPGGQRICHSGFPLSRRVGDVSRDIAKKVPFPMEAWVPEVYERVDGERVCFPVNQSPRVPEDTITKKIPQISARQTSYVRRQSERNSNITTSDPILTATSVKVMTAGQILIITASSCIAFGLICLSVLVVVNRWRVSRAGRASAQQVSEKSAIAPPRLGYQNQKSLRGARLPIYEVRTDDEVHTSQRTSSVEVQASTHIGLDGTNDGWTKWIITSCKRKIDIPKCSSPGPQRAAPRLPTLRLPKPTLATVRNFSGIGPDVEKALGEKRIKWGSTV
ncbi:hypothetical protein BGZ60DRAFT_529042 [Tricladium varicosporioides]|nr:hypothetical protein BGZ60DRAFT_529042 [Hymenoscyphus varicosporioides]